MALVGGEKRGEGSENGSLGNFPEAASGGGLSDFSSVESVAPSDCRDEEDDAVSAADSGVVFRESTSTRVDGSDMESFGLGIPIPMLAMHQSMKGLPL